MVDAKLIEHSFDEGPIDVAAVRMGIGSFRVQLRMTGWRFPGKGPSQPNARKRRIISCRLIGLGIGRLRVEVDPVQNRQRIAKSQGHHQPVFQNA